MTNPQIYLRLDGRGNRQYFPGETLAGSYFLNEIRNDQIEAVEISVLWYTEGKGSSDFGIHAFWRRSNMAGDWIDPRQPGRFSTTLPSSPLSYLGVLIRIHWSVRIRVFLENGEQMVEELRFRLGDLPDVRTLRLEQSGTTPVKGGKA